MPKIRFTKGPWKTEHMKDLMGRPVIRIMSFTQGWRVGEFIAWVGSGRPTTRDRANAKLIEQAPMLMEGGKALVDVLGPIVNRWHCNGTKKQKQDAERIIEAAKGLLAAMEAVNA